MKTINRIAFEGSDKSGKSKALRYCRERFSNVAEFAEEAATVLGGPKHDEADAASMFAFQSRVLETQLQLEDEAMKRAEASGKHLVICDRGVPGASAFHPEGLEGFMRDYGLDEQDILNRYNAVFLLDPSASKGVETDTESNPARKVRTQEEIMHLHHKIELAYAHHPRVIHIPYLDKFDDKWALIEPVLQQFVE